MVAWASLEEFVQQRLNLGVAGRRFAALDETTRAQFLRHVRPRLESLSPEDFVDRGEVIVAVATAAG